MREGGGEAIQERERETARESVCLCVFVGECVFQSCVSHEVLVPGLAELDQVWFDAVHLLVDLSVVGSLFLQVHLQVTFAVHNLADARLQLVIVFHNP